MAESNEKKEIKLQYFKGAKPGIKQTAKRKSSSERDSKTSKKKYEEARPRAFKDDWKVGRAWLNFDGVQMVCTICHSFYEKKIDTLNESSKVWINGTNNLKLDAVKRHESSQMHKDANKAKDNKDNIQDSEASIAIKQLNKAEYEHLSHCFRNAHAIAKHDKSFKDYIWLCKLDKAKGLNPKSIYQSDKSARTFVSYVADVEKCNTEKYISATSFYSLTVDGATDVAGDEQESIYLHFANKGERKQRFLQFVKPESTTSEHVYSSIVNALQDNNLDSEKIVGLTTDGAANMMGKKKGLAALFREKNSDIIVTHCLAHRLELSVKDAIKQSQPKLHDKSMTLLMGLYYFYKKSHKQRQQLRRTFELFAQTCVFPSRVGGTRWVPHTVRAIEIFIRAYDVFCAHLENASHSTPKAEGLCKLAQDIDVVAYIFVLQVICQKI